jgi:hypothetical protein
MTAHRRNFVYLSLLAILSGCATSVPFLTESARHTLTAKGLEEVHYFLTAEVTFRSVRELDTTSETGPFRPDLHRTLQVLPETPGKFVRAGDGWITVDFGQGIQLTFYRGAEDGVYAMRGWGTLTIEGERYDIRIGMRSGENLRVRYDAGGGK